MDSEFVKKVGEKELDALLAAGKPVLVDFFAEWCGPCKAMAPVLESLAREREGTIEVVKVDVDEEQSVASRFSVRAMPTFAMFAPDGSVERFTGATRKEVLASLVDRAIERSKATAGA